MILQGILAGQLLLPDIAGDVYTVFTIFVLFFSVEIKGIQVLTGLHFAVLLAGIFGLHEHFR